LKVGYAEGVRVALSSALVTALAIAAPREALAYCYYAACFTGTDASGAAQYDSEEFCDGETIPLNCHVHRWKTSCSGFTIQKDGGTGLSTSVLDKITKQAFATWEGLDCGNGAHPGVYIDDMGLANCNVVEYNSDAGNQNVIIVRDQGWYSTPTEDTIALTTPTVDLTTGEILDADIELNAVNFHFTTSDTMVDTDLLSVLQHETGHFLGLAHSMSDPNATMRPDYPGTPGDLSLRNPDADDATAICRLYRPNPAITSTCNPLGRHGFSPDCKANQTEGHCAFSPSAGDTAFGAVACVGIAAAFLGVRRRRALRIKGPSRPRRRATR